MQTWFFDSPDPEQTFQYGVELGRSIGFEGLAIALIGPLGAGKTVFVKGLASGLGVDPGIVSSPTFVIAAQYPLQEGPEALHHVDLYRLESPSELEAIGFYDMLAPRQVVAVEWADRFPDVLGKKFLSIEFEGPSPAEEDAARENTAWRGRRAEVHAFGDDADRILGDWSSRVERHSDMSAGYVMSSPEMRALIMLVIALGLFVSGRVDFESAGPACTTLVATASDDLGSSHVRCGLGTADAAQPLEGMARLLNGDAIDLNRASGALLQRLPEIGPARADLIVRSRERMGPFENVEDLERVSGIGPKTRARVGRWIWVSVPESGRSVEALGERHDG